MKQPITNTIIFSILSGLFTIPGLGLSAEAIAMDPFNINTQAPAPRANTIFEGQDPCRFDTLKIPLALPEAVERVLCNNPKSHQAWAEAKIQAAHMGTRMAAYLPTIEANANITQQKNDTAISGMHQLDSDTRPNLQNTSLQMSMVLMDFGHRKAQLEEARALLETANAIQDEVLQTLLLDAAALYYTTLSAQAAKEAAAEAERVAQESLHAATAKYQAGVAARMDQLQARTAYARAHLEHVKVEGELKNAQGTLAIAMGLPVDTQADLVPHNGILPTSPFLKPVNELVTEALQQHPQLAALHAEVSAARASVDATRAEGRPTVSLGAELSHQKERDQLPSLGFPTSHVTRNSRAIGVQVNIPLFDGYGRRYRTIAAENKVEQKLAQLEEIEREITLKVWSSYQLLETETASLKASEELLEDARQAFAVARGRYKSGLGSMLDLLDTQLVLAEAQQQRIRSLSSWHEARLKLAASIGKIGLWAIH